MGVTWLRGRAAQKSTTEISRLAYLEGGAPRMPTDLLMEPKDTDLEDRRTEEGDADEVQPFRYAISSYGADYPVDSLVKRIREGAIYVPKFQREFVWDIKDASRFVESLLLGLPVPSIFLSIPESGIRASCWWLTDSSGRSRCEISTTILGDLAGRSSA